MGYSRYLIYGLIDPFSGALRYIGRSSSGLKRPESHSMPSSLKANTYKTYWVKSVLARGRRPVVDILEECGSQEELDTCEREWIQAARNAWCDLTNLTDGGGGNLGKPLSAETRRKLSEKLKGKLPPNTGKPHSLETKARISAANKGKPGPKTKHSESSKIKISRSRGLRAVVDEKGNVYETQGLASRALGVQPCKISQVLSGSRKSVGGHTFKYVENDGRVLPPTQTVREYKRRPVSDKQPWLEAYVSGLNGPQVAEKFGVPLPTVYRYLRANSVLVNRKPVR